MTPPPPFATRLLEWWAEHGRHDLPWQHPRSAYRVWVSEIMLQQTRVETVIPYFQRFMARFPTLTDLAGAPLDDVLTHWSGLGYYARARNLHAAAGLCVEHHQGELPRSLDALQSLPGIGRTTAAAILAQAHDQPEAILDGNVKRVLARHAGIRGWPGRPAVTRQLWTEAEARTPAARAADYTQAIMDLGATICTRKSPQCDRCPVHTDCMALVQDLVSELPEPRPRKHRPRRESDFWVVRDGAGRVLMSRRPPAGIWGGLWCLPETDQLPPGVQSGEVIESIEHGFTHFRLTLKIRRGLIERRAAVIEEDGLAWMEPEDCLDLGLPRPIRTALENHIETTQAETAK